MKDYHKILGVKPTASQEEIKNAYRKLRRKHHPDFNPGNEEAAREKMGEINEAYGALSGPKIRVFDDKPKRRRYQQHGGTHVHRQTRYSQAERNRVRRAIYLLLALAGFILFTNFLANLQRPDYSDEDFGGEYYDDYDATMTRTAVDSGRVPAEGVAFCTVITIRDTYGYEPNLKATVGFILDGTELIVVPDSDSDWAKIRNRAYGDFIRLEDVEVIHCQ